MKKLTPRLNIYIYIYYSLALYTNNINSEFTRWINSVHLAGYYLMPVERKRARERKRDVAKWPPLNKLSTLYIRMESISSCLPEFHCRGDSSPSRRTISYRSSRNSALRIRLAFRNTGRVDRSESVKLWERSICLSDKRKKKEKEERLMGYINSKEKYIYIHVGQISHQLETFPLSRYIKNNFENRGNFKFSFSRDKFCNSSPDRFKLYNT